MYFFIFSGCIAFISGIMLILCPQALASMTNRLNKIVANFDNQAIRYRLGLGISLMLTGACLWFVAYYMNAMPILQQL